jgi:glutaredoxin
MRDPDHPIRIDIYSRPGCHLCDDAKEAVERAGRRHDFVLRILNIEDDPQLKAAYGSEIPVVFINGIKAFKFRVDEAQLERKLKQLWKT